MTISICRSVLAYWILGLSIFVLTTVASPVYPPARRPTSQQQHPTVHYGSMPHRDHPTDTKSHKANELHGRMMPGQRPAFQVHQVRFRLMTGLLPVQAAASMLENLFMSVATQADPQRGEWAKQVPTNELNIKYGMLRLSFRCIGDTIPWTFVKGFAENLWEAAALGLADLFETVYQDPSGRVAVQISLTLANEAVEAVGSGSGSGSDQDFWREGSWDSVQSGNGA